jgi:pyrimidine-nucleoside phosphorylase
VDFREVIRAVAHGEDVTAEMMTAVAEGAATNSVPDYQLAAWLMAVYLKGLPPEAVYRLTLAMAQAGGGPPVAHPGRVDKHSTGGVGDKTTLVVAPVVASVGIPVAKMSGRGLGHTGGTLDKLESIPGFRVHLPREEFVRLVDAVGVAVVAQSAELAPADGRLYALRDAIAAVDSLPLIASSIMSKKIAGGAPALVLDVKVGRGGFMPSRAEAETLARMMLDIARRAERRARALLTAMDQPLGFAVGNAVEVNEAVDTLEGKGPADFTELVRAVATAMLKVAGYGGDPAQAVEEALASGRARAKFDEWVRGQGGDPDSLSGGKRLPLAPVVDEVAATRDGVVAGVDPRVVGEAALVLGAGRRLKTDAVDPGVGVRVMVKVGDPVEAGMPLASVWARDPAAAATASALVRRAIRVGDPGPTSGPVVLGELASD